jgi:hypothetical protein
MAGQVPSLCLTCGRGWLNAGSMAQSAERSIAAGMGLLIATLPAAPAMALPMSYAGSTTVGAEFDPHWSTFWFSHAIDRRQGLGFSANLLSAQHGTHAEQGDEAFLLLDYTKLLKRWNMQQAQANVWLFGGVGVYSATGSSGGHSHHGFKAPGEDSALRFAARPGIQLDVETTRLRLEGRGLLYLAPGVQQPQLSATAGVALTPARYNGVQPWMEFQVRAMPEVIDTLELIPKLRLLHKRVVLDIGYSNLGTVMGGVTYIF